MPLLASQIVSCWFSNAGVMPLLFGADGGPRGREVFARGTSGATPLLAAAHQPLDARARAEGSSACSGASSHLVCHPESALSFSTPRITLSLSLTLHKEGNHKKGCKYRFIPAMRNMLIKNTFVVVVVFVGPLDAPPSLEVCVEHARPGAGDWPLCSAQHWRASTAARGPAQVPQRPVSGTVPQATITRPK